jgi:16S rRNA (uracil1498-N3)-methyltransferase
MNFTPILTERCEHEIGSKFEAKKEHWQSVIMAACKQCHRVLIPQINEPLKFSDAVENTKKGLIGLINETTMSVSDALKKHDFKMGDSISVFIGPEGGFTSRETSLAKENNLLPVTFGANALRAETAAIVSSAIILG